MTAAAAHCQTPTANVQAAANLSVELLVDRDGTSARTGFASVTLPPRYEVAHAIHIVTPSTAVNSTFSSMSVSSFYGAQNPGFSLMWWGWGGGGEGGHRLLRSVNSGENVSSS